MSGQFGVTLMRPRDGEGVRAVSLGSRHDSAMDGLGSPRAPAAQQGIFLPAELVPGWNAMKRHVSSWTDGLGQPLDEGIVDTVVALNLKGLPTKASCEGHEDRGLPVPWVDIGVRLDRRAWWQFKQRGGLIRAVRTFQLQVNRRRYRLPSYTRLGLYFPPAHRARNQRYVDRVQRLLDQFYASRPRGSYALTAVRFEDSNAVRILSGALDRDLWYQPETQSIGRDERRALLKGARHEMLEFTRFIVATL